VNILGLSAFHHDSAACLVVDGDIVAAAQEERFTRKKRDSSFPMYAISYCLEEARITAADLDFVVFYDKPFLKFERLFQNCLPVYLKDNPFQMNVVSEALKMHLGHEIDWTQRLLFSEHHLSHAASAFFPSPFQDAAILILDGVGDWTPTSLAIGSGHTLCVHQEIHYPHSLGLLYSAFTQYTGFKVNSGEYKVMGLAPYGEPKYAKLIKDHLIDIKEDGSFQLDMRYFNKHSDLTLTSDRFSYFFGGPARQPEGPLTQRDMDLAASVQTVTEEVIIKLAKNLQKSTRQKNLCLAGGMALNCVANGKLLREKVFENIWIQPASGNAGGAIGAALGAYHLMLNQPRSAKAGDGMKGSYLGPAYSQSDTEQRLKAIGAVFIVTSEVEMINQAAQAVVDGKAVGWHQGRMEFGPRALGSRSIVADPRSPYVQKQLNLKVKFRESFRPFAPSVLREDVSDWFDIQSDSPYMLLVADVENTKKLRMTNQQKQLAGIEKLNAPRSDIPAVTHIDYSARIQTVHSETNSKFHKLISKFKEFTGCPVLVNTSFNVRGEPIVNTPEEAFHCLMGTDIEFLVVGNCIMRKEDQDSALIKDYKSAHELD